jgi:hypothetical protein
LKQMLNSWKQVSLVQVGLGNTSDPFHTCDGNLAMDWNPDRPIHCIVCGAKFTLFLAFLEPNE